jgi:hypothetical protein
MVELFGRNFIEQNRNRSEQQEKEHGEPDRPRIAIAFAEISIVEQHEDQENHSEDCRHPPETHRSKQADGVDARMRHSESNK